MEYRFKQDIHIAQIPALIAEQAQRLQKTWWTEDDFVELFPASPDGFTTAYFLLEQLKKLQLLEVRLADATHELRLPAHYADFRFPEPLELPDRVRLSRWAYLRSSTEDLSERNTLRPYL